MLDEITKVLYYLYIIILNLSNIKTLFKKYLRLHNSKNAPASNYRTTKNRCTIDHCSLLKTHLINIQYIFLKYYILFNEAWRNVDIGLVNIINERIKFI